MTSLPHSSTLAWKIPRREEPGGLQSMGSLRVGRDWATSLSCIGEGNGNPLQCSCLENPRDGGAWWAAVYGVAQSQTQLKWLSSSSSCPKSPCFPAADFLSAVGCQWWHLGKGSTGGTRTIVVPGPFLYYWDQEPYQCHLERLII